MGREDEESIRSRKKPPFSNFQGGDVQDCDVLYDELASKFHNRSLPSLIAAAHIVELNLPAEEIRPACISTKPAPQGITSMYEALNRDRNIGFNEPFQESVIWQGKQKNATHLNHKQDFDTSQQKPNHYYDCYETTFPAWYNTLRPVPLWTVANGSPRQPKLGHREQKLLPSPIPTSSDRVVPTRISSPPKKQPKRSDKWCSHLEELRHYKDIHGHCLVPQKYTPNRSLGRWVMHQRVQYRLLQDGKPSSMTPQRVKSLEDLEFVWDPAKSSVVKEKHDKQWQARYEELLLYVSVHGNCLVPRHYAPNPVLGRWVDTQRTQFRQLTHGNKKHLTFERLDKLQKIGFEFTRYA